MMFRVGIKTRNWSRFKARCPRPDLFEIERATTHVDGLLMLCLDEGSNPSSSTTD